MLRLLKYKKLGIELRNALAKVIWWLYIKEFNYWIIVFYIGKGKGNKDKKFKFIYFILKNDLGYSFN